jgi:hypothetical protein
MTTSYAQFNTLTITGRVNHAEIVTGQYGEFLALTLLSELVSDAEPIAIKIRSNNGLMKAFHNGNLPNGRRLTVTGHLSGMSELFLNKTTGKRAVRKRPEISMTNVVIMDGGYGPKPKADKNDGAVVEIDDAPELDDKDFEVSAPAVDTKLAEAAGF